MGVSGRRLRGSRLLLCCQFWLCPLTSLFCFVDMPLRSTSETTELGMVLDRPMKYLRCHFTASITTDGPTSFGKSGHSTVFGDCFSLSLACCLICFSNKSCECQRAGVGSGSFCEANHCPGLQKSKIAGEEEPANCNQQRDLSFEPWELLKLCTPASRSQEVL